MMLLASVLSFESLFYLLSSKYMLLIKNMLGCFLGFFLLKAEIFDLLLGQAYQLILQAFTQECLMTLNEKNFPYSSVGMPLSAHKFCPLNKP